MSRHPSGTAPASPAMDEGGLGHRSCWFTDHVLRKASIVSSLPGGVCLLQSSGASRRGRIVSLSQLGLLHSLCDVARSLGHKSFQAHFFFIPARALGKTQPQSPPIPTAQLRNKTKLGITFSHVWCVILYPPQMKVRYWSSMKSLMSLWNTGSQRVVGVPWRIPKSFHRIHKVKLFSS